MSFLTRHGRMLSWSKERPRYRRVGAVSDRFQLLRHRSEFRLQKCGTWSQSLTWTMLRSSQFFQLVQTPQHRVCRSAISHRIFLSGFSASGAFSVISLGELRACSSSVPNWLSNECRCASIPLKACRDRTLTQSDSRQPKQQPSAA